MYKANQNNKKRNSKNTQRTNNNNNNQMMMMMINIITITIGTLTYLHPNPLIWKHIGLVTPKMYLRSFSKNLLKCKYKKVPLKRVFNSLRKMRQIITKVQCEKYILTLTKNKYTKNLCKSHENTYKNFILDYY